MDNGAGTAMVVIQEPQIGSERRDVAGGVDEAFAAVVAARSRGVRDERHAAAAHRLVGDERAALLEGRQQEHVAPLQEGLGVVDEADDLDARVVEPGGEQVAVAGRERAGDDSRPRAATPDSCQARSA